MKLIHFSRMILENCFYSTIISSLLVILNEYGRKFYGVLGKFVDFSKGVFFEQFFGIVVIDMMHIGY